MTEAIEKTKLEVLSGDEIERLVTALERGQRDYTPGEAARVVDWAQATRVSNAFLDLVLEGRVTVLVLYDGNLAFKRYG